jgi:TPP-dependent indolepyruvate ferredoxin oxidoreductase alpha subunit
MSKEDFKKFWEMISKANETTLTVDNLYSAFTSTQDVPSALIEGMKKNGFENLARVNKQDTGATVLYFGAKTINNLPLLIEISHTNGNMGA